MNLKNATGALMVFCLLAGVISSCTTEEITEVTQVINNDTTIVVTNNNDTTIIINNVGDTMIFTNKSNLEPLVALSPQFNFVKAFSLISSSDT
ncbi:hypothetical protein C9994_17075, partial [Marivirga lumbricoides]